MELRETISPDGIRRNWLSSQEDYSNPCSGCPRKDEERKAHPYFAVAGSNLELTDEGLACEDVAVEELPEEIDVMLIGESPGGTNTYAGEDRTAKNTPESINISTGAPEYPLPMYEDGDPVGNVGDWEEFAIQLAKHWPTEQRGNLGIYYTNHTKCSDIHSVDGDCRLIDRGGDHCSQYLLPEINYVDPDALIVFSGNRANHLRTALTDVGIPMSRSGTVKEVVFDENKLSVNDPENHPFQLYSSGPLPDTLIFASYYWNTLARTAHTVIPGAHVYPQQYLSEDLTNPTEQYAAGMAGAIIEELA